MLPPATTGIGPSPPDEALVGSAPIPLLASCSSGLWSDICGLCYKPVARSFSRRPCAAKDGGAEPTGTYSRRVSERRIVEQADRGQGFCKYSPVLGVMTSPMPALNTTGTDSTRRPAFLTTTKCKCGPVLNPVFPEAAIFSPRSTR